MDPYSTAFETEEDRQSLVVTSKSTLYGGEAETQLQNLAQPIFTLDKGDGYEQLGQIVHINSLRRELNAELLPLSTLVTRLAHSVNVARTNLFMSVGFFTVDELCFSSNLYASCNILVFISVLKECWSQILVMVCSHKERFKNATLTSFLSLQLCRERCLVIFSCILVLFPLNLDYVLVRELCTTEMFNLQYDALEVTQMFGVCFHNLLFVLVIQFVCLVDCVIP